MRKLLSLLPKPSRYIGIEEGSVHKRPEDVSFHMALAFPDMYEVGMSYLGQKILMDILNQRPDWWAERVFTPCQEAGQILREHHTLLCTLESDTPLHALDAIGFSITHELCYTNILYMLDLAGIPLHSKDRINPQQDGTPWPLITAGGGCTLAAEPLAPYIDIMLLGEGEESIVELMDLVAQAKQEKMPRQELLLAAGKLAGVYVPSLFTPTGKSSAESSSTPYLEAQLPEHAAILRRVIPDMDSAPYPAKQAIPFGAVHNRLALEIGRGCTRGCRFCQAGSIYRPARERSVANLTHLVEKCLNSTGYDDVSFLSLSSGDFSALKQLFMNTIDRCAQEQISVSLPSLRVGSIDDTIMERIAGIRRTGATLAPEAGSQRLRDVINKGVTEEQLILHVQKLFEHGWEQVKLYFMIGLPTETDEDILAILDLCKKARDAAGPGIKRLQITAALSPFVPKPHTPFQWEQQASMEEIRRRVGLLLHAVKQEKRIKLRWHEPEMSYLEGVFSRGDRQLAPVIETAYRKGAIFTSWIDQFSLAPWLEAFAEHGIAPTSYLRERQEDEALPWDHLHSGLSKEYFIRERNNSRQEKTIPDCRYGACQVCGACDLKNSSSLLRSPGQNLPPLRTILNQPQRDQEAHSVTLDQYGRVVPKYGVHAPQGEEKKKGKKQPPSLPEHLARKRAHLRLWYSKTGAAAFLSQLELQDIFNRAMRRANLPLSFSQGYHPLPLLSFGKALPVGVSSRCEWLCVYLSERVDLRTTLETLNTALPKGLRITRIEELPLRKQVFTTIQETYRLSLADNAPCLPETFMTAWLHILSMTDIAWTRETKKSTKECNARLYIAKATPHHDGSVSLTCDWAVQGYVSPLALCLYLLQQANCPLEQHQIELTKIETQLLLDGQ